ncbi:hypothetical protein PTTG_30342, partial [Puccinia triticina 1-1 BBBD Race 1]
EQEENMANIDNSGSSDSSAGGRPMMKVPKFSGENFEIWEKKIRMVLSEYNLERFIDDPPLPKMSARAKRKAQIAANLLCANLTDGVFNTIVKKNNCNNPYELWNMFKSVYASDLILASYEVWAKWEETQFNDNMATYIVGIEECLAKFESLGMIVPDFVICCSIISRITKKRPFLMQSLFVSRFEASNKRKAPTEGSSGGGTTTALITNVPNKKKKPYNPIRCYNNKHNPASNHTAENCWTVNPKLYQEHLEKQKEKEKGSSYHTTIQQSNSGSQSGIRPSFSYLLSAD